MKQLKIFILLILCSILLAVSAYSPRAYASFNQNSIISEGLFNQSGSLSASDINSFLNSFPNSCISPNSGFAAVLPTGYSPSGGFTYGGYTTAGQVIATAAQTYGLNPKVLIVTLQKEQSLVAGGVNFCNNGDENKYAAAAGYGCPDGGTVYNWSGVSLYSRNGVPHTTTGSTCVNSALKAGFSQQVIRAAWLLKFGQQRALGNVNWAVIQGSWDNSDDPLTCYGGPMTQGNYKRCSSGSSVYYDGYTTIDGTTVHIDNGATAALYWYTPHFHGNQNFVSIYESWFGSTLMNCTFPSTDGSTVFRLYSPTLKSHFLTTDPNEVCIATGLSGYLYDAPQYPSESSGGVPVYRLVAGGKYLYTSSAAERDSAVQNYGYRYEGIGFQGVDPVSNPSIARPVYRLASLQGGGYLYTISAAERDSAAQNYGYRYEGISFYVRFDTGEGAVTDTYRLAQPGSGTYLYTSSAAERDSAVQNYGYRYEGIGFQAFPKPNAYDVPVYRLAGSHGYILTANPLERVVATQLGYRSEGITFYAFPADSNNSTVDVYRLANPVGTYLYTTSAAERDSAAQNYGYRYEGIGFRAP